MIGQSFKSTYKNYTSPKFTKHQVCNGLGMGRDPPKSIKDRLKNLYPIKPEQLKQKPQAPISQAGKV